MFPPRRKKIITKIVAPQKRSAAYEFIRGEIKKGRQAFVICPRIEADQRGIEEVEEGHGNNPRISQPASLRETLQAGAYTKYNDPLLFASIEMKSVKAEYEKLSKTIFPDLRVGMLHGQLQSKDKESIMKQFSDGELDILVSTSVVEVGVDVPNTTIMMIEGAERFGLAQLYQFRGRVGRGNHQSFCLLFTDSDSYSVRERLQAILKAKNGFELAEKDLKLRGPGEFLGQKQTGLPDVAMGGLQNPELIKISREAAVTLLTNDRNLNKYKQLKTRLDEFYNKIHLE
jgi:ATP-dependent DNA helicase RecG